MSKKKFIFSICFFVSIVSLTFYSIFKETSIKVCISILKEIKPIYGFICIGLVIIYFVFQGIYNQIIYKSLNTKISLAKGIFYSLTEFFYSAITPSSTGGQPVELIYMQKDKLTIRKSIIVLILNTIYFKLFMIIFGIIILLFKTDFVFNNGSLFKILFFIGFFGDALLIIGCELLSFRPNVVKKIVSLIVKIQKLFKIKNESSIDEITKKYQNETEYVKKHKFDVFIGLIITFIQRISLFSIAFVIFKAFNLTGYNYFDLLFIQIAVHMCTEFVPLPGGSGISEYLYNILFINVYGSSLAQAGMIMTRIFSFYLPLLIIMFIIVYVTKTRYMDGKDEK